MTDRTSRELGRREFLARGAIAAAGVAVAGFGSSGVAAPKRVVKDGMAYRRLGRTELMVSEIGLGGSPSPPEAIFKAALDRGVNLMDSSAFYGEGEAHIGRMIQGRRDEVIVCTKFFTQRFSDEDAKESSIAAVEKALGRMQTDTIDIMCVHGVGAPEHCLKEGVVEAFAELKQQGKIRFTGLSNHQDPATVIPPILESGHYDVVLLALSRFMGRRRPGEERPPEPEPVDDWLGKSGCQTALDAAAKHDVGVIAMKTMAGGARQKVDAYQTGETTLAQAKLKWALSSEAISSAVSELTNFDILEENLAAVGTTLTPTEEAMLDQHVRERSAYVCRMCGTCQSTCPQRAPVPDVMRFVTYHDEHGKRERARRGYQRLASRLAAACGTCDECTVKCPYGVDVPERLAHAAMVLG